MRSRIVLAAIAALALAAPACEDGGPVLPTRTPTDLPTDSTDLPTEVPTELPSGAGNLTSGTAHMELSGDISFSADLALTGNGIYAPPPGAIGLTYADEGGNNLSLGGTSFTGLELTSESLIVSVGVVNDEFFGIFVSSGGECTVTLGDASEEAVDGAISCTGLTSGDTTVDLEATFSASA